MNEVPHTIYLTNDLLEYVRKPYSDELHAFVDKRIWDRAIMALREAERTGMAPNNVEPNGGQTREMVRDVLQEAEKINGHP